MIGETIMKMLIIYYILINLLAFIAMYVDKQKAKSNKWRISEKALIMMSIFGGSIGMLCGMKEFRHKTKHAKFKYGVPIILIVQILIFIYCVKLLNI